MASIFSVIISFLLGFFKKKEQGVAAIDTVIDEKQEALNEVQIAKKLRDIPDDAVNSRVQQLFERKD